MKTDAIKDRNKCCQPEMVIVVGASAGGLKEIKILVEGFPPGFQGTMIVANHRMPSRSNVLIDILDRHARVRVHEPVDEQALECTTIYVGSSNSTVEVHEDEFEISFDTSRYARIHRIDDLFKSVAASVGKNAVGVILSGMLKDGTAGLEAIRDAGGYCMVQCPDDATFDSMPTSAIGRVTPNFIGTTQEISRKLTELAIERAQD